MRGEAALGTDSKVHRAMNGRDDVCMQRFFGNRSTMRNAGGERSVNSFTLKETR